MCTNSCQKYEFPKSADQGWTATVRPPTSYTSALNFNGPSIDTTVFPPIHALVGGASITFDTTTGLQSSFTFTTFRDFISRDREKSFRYSS